MLKQIKFLFVAALLLELCIAASAQNTITHIVRKGETIASIAKKYGTTEQEITRLNNLIYEGMELILPVVDNQETEIETNRTESFYASHRIKNEEAETKKVKKVKPFDFGNIGASYMAAFDFADRGYYLLSWSVYTETFGFDFMVGSNLGLVPLDYAGAIFAVGLNYSYMLSDKTLISVSPYLIGTDTSTEPDDVRKMNNIEKESVFKLGIALEPRITFKFGKVTPYVGLPVQWIFGSSSISVPFRIGVGFFH